MELEHLFLLVVDGNSQDIRRQQVGGKLDSFKPAIHGLGQRFGHRGLARAGIVFKQHMSADLAGKVIVTNTTTEKDMVLFRERGVRYVMTTTPVLNGRSFGTNMMEAALTALAGKGRPLTHTELDELIDQLDLKPTLHDLSVQPA